MSLDEWHLVFVSVCLVLVIAACAPVVLAYMKIGEEQFFALAVLGEEGMVEKYYPDDDPNIEVGEEIHWSLYLYNHMGETQYVAVRVKLLNSTMAAPNSTSCSPSPAQVFYEVRRVLFDNETWLHPFSWSIENVGPVGNFLNIELLSVNDENIETNFISKDGNNILIVLELWVYDESLNDFQFGWSSGDELRCAWNQIWFNVTLPG